MATPPISVEFSQLLLLNSTLPTGFRTPFPDASSTHVIQQAIQSLKGGRIVNTAQAKKIDELKMELVELKGKPRNANAIANNALDMGVELAHPTSPKSTLAKKSDTDAQTTLTLETLTRERADYQFCITELMMYITGEGSEARPVIDFAKLREVLEAAREGGWTLRALAGGIEEIAPADPEIVRKRKEKWEGGGRRTRG